MAETLEEIREHRKEIAEKFEGTLPDYLTDYFDEKELKRVEADFYDEIRKDARDKTWEERRDFVKDRDEKFWEENETEISRLQRRTDSPVFLEPPRNEEREEQERDLTEEEVRVLISLCEKDLYLFAIRYFPHYLKRQSSKFHKFLYGTLERETNKKRRDTGFRWAIAAPRGNAKSSIVSGIYPLWCVCYGKKKFIIMLSKTASMAEDFLTDIKAELEGNAKLIKDFPHVCGKGIRWRANEIITNNSVKVLALGTGSQIRGRKFGIHRPGLILSDDLEDPEMVRSDVTREFIRYTWFNKDLLFTAGEKGSVTDVFVVGTILGKDSLLNNLLDSSEYPGWSTRRFKAVEKFSDSPLWEKWQELYEDRFDVDRSDTAKKFYEEHEEEMLEGTEVLWPEGDPYYDLMKVWIEDRSAFYCFDKDTDIVLADYSTKKISNIESGDLILSGNGNREEVIDIGTSNLDGRGIYDIKIAGQRDKIRVTEDHPFLTYSRVWKNVNELTVSDTLVFPSQTGILCSKIQSIEKVEVDDDYRTYWMSVTGNKTFCIPGAVVHNSEKQNSPIDVTKIYVTKDQLHWERMHSGIYPDMLKKCHHFGALDPSLGKKSRFGDYSCITTIARDPKTGYMYVVNIDMKRRSVDEQIEAVLTAHEKYNYHQFAVETNAFQLVVADNLRKLSRESGLYVPVLEINNYSDKKMRIEGIIPFILDGTIVFWKEKYDTVRMYNQGVDQLLTFTGDGDRHDDFPDSLEMAIRIAKKPRFRLITKQTG